MSIYIITFDDSMVDEWDTFVSTSRNGTVFHSRRFLCYHQQGRFHDHSLMFYDHQRLLAVLPAAELTDDSKRLLVSHPGASYGGLVLSNDCSVSDTGAIIDALLSYGANQQFAALSMLRITPQSVRCQYADDQEYWLYQRSAQLSRLEMDGAIDLRGWSQNDLLMHLSGKCRNAVRQAQRSGLTVRISDDWASFWAILEATLSAKHGAKPTHTLVEIQRLSTLLGNDLRLFAAHDSSRMVGGIVTVTLHAKAIYTLYIAQDYAMQKAHPVHLILSEIIHTCITEQRDVLHLGVSTEDGGKVVNEGLFFFKESFGMKPVRRESWMIEL